jgi:hypothetical protein
VKAKAEYLDLREKFRPEKFRAIFVAESPPASGGYFYDPNGRVTEKLFSALMKAIGFKYKEATKTDGLLEFQCRGLFLLDATYRPVNKLPPPDRNNQILEDYPKLLDDLRAIKGIESIPIILVKKDVCRLLEPKLDEDGFNVANQGQLLYFPSHSRERKFQTQLKAILARSRMGL